MSNTNQALTHQMIAREAAKMLVEENMVVANLNTDRESDIGKETAGYKSGDSVRVMIPPVPVVFSGATFAGGGSAPATNETSVDVTCDQQKHVALTFGAKEKRMELTDFSKRFLRPAMNSLSAIVNASLLETMKDKTPNVVGTWNTTPATRAVWREAASKLNRGLAPADQRYAHFSEDANNALAEANSTLFHSAKELQGEFSDNAVGHFAGLEFYTQQSLPVHTNGAGAGYLVDGAAESGATITVKTGTGAITKGSIITIAGVFAVHPLTGVSTGVLRQFVVTATHSGGAGDISISPSLIPTTSTVVGTVNALPADSAPITIFGDAGESEAQNLVFHRDAFATAFVPLPVLASCEGYTATVKGISVRVMTFGNGQTDQEHTRIDVLYASPAAVRPLWACRVTE